MDKTTCFSHGTAQTHYVIWKTFSFLRTCEKPPSIESALLFLKLWKMNLWMEFFWKKTESGLNMSSKPRTFDTIIINYPSISTLRREVKPPTMKQQNNLFKNFNRKLNSVTDDLRDRLINACSILWKSSTRVVFTRRSKALTQNLPKTSLIRILLICTVVLLPQGLPLHRGYLCLHFFYWHFTINII